MKLLVTLIGLILVLEGLPYAAAPDAMRTWLKQLAAMEAKHLRLAGIAAMIMGFVLLLGTLRTGFFG